MNTPEQKGADAPTKESSPEDASSVGVLGKDMLKGAVKGAMAGAVKGAMAGALEGALDEVNKSAADAEEAKLEKQAEHDRK